MGAISGTFSFSPGAPVDVLALRRMSDVQRHRGPATDRIHVGERIGIASRRQAFADGTAEPQLMSNDAGTLWIAFSGELFDTHALRADLEGRGARFATTGDAELVLRAYDTLGLSCLDRFNGQFAFGVWDARATSLLLARDPMGIQPLHYMITADHLLFASEAKGILAHPSVSTAIDEEALAETLLCGTVFDGRTIFASLRRLPPGAALIASPSGHRILRYWTLPEPDEIGGGVAEQDLVEELAALCGDAVRLRTSGNQPWGVLLSGGTDSTAMAAWAQRAAPQPIETFSVDFPNTWKRTDTDRHYAGLVAKWLGTAHHSFTLDPREYFEALETLAWHLEKPHNKGGATMYLAARAAAPRARVLLSGEGIDEMLGGYVGSRGLWPDEEPPSDITCFPWAPYWRAIATLLCHDFVERARPEEIFGQRLRDSVARAPRADAVNRSLHLYMTCFLQDLLELHDQATVAAGVETRVPFLDRRCVELIAPLPSRFKVRNGVTKYIFRRAIAGLVPPDVLQRRKTHLPMPFDPSSLAMQLELARRLLLDGEARTSRYIDPVGLRTFLGHGGAPGGDMLTVWQVTMILITLELLLRAYEPN